MAAILGVCRKRKTLLYRVGGYTAAMDRAFLQDRITATKAQIVAFEDAALALGTGGIQSYTLDTGQSRQTVTKLDLEWIQRTIDSLYNRCATLEARLNGGSVVVSPAW